MTPIELALALLLAQTCVAEISFTSVEECELMWQVNQQNSDDKGRTLGRQTRLFNSYWRSKRQRVARKWVGELNEAGKRPKHWPKKLSWEVNKHRWLAILKAAQRFAVSPYDKTILCKGAIDYGAPNERPKAWKRMMPLHCLKGCTLQRYWGWK